MSGAANFLKIPKYVLAQLECKYDAHKADSSNPIPRLVIAKHHFPVDLKSKKLQWLMPLTKESINELDSYKNRSPPPNMDGLLIYDPNLGKGQLVRSKKKNLDRKLSQVAPFCTTKEVTDIAAAVQNRTSGTAKSRIDMHGICEAYKANQLQYEQELDALDIEAVQLRSGWKFTASMTQRSNQMQKHFQICNHKLIT